MITVEVTQDSLRSLSIKMDEAAKGTQSGLRSGINAATIFLASSIKKDYLSGQYANRRTGNLSRAVFSKMESDTTGLVGVGAEAPYGRFVNDGTAPHVIEARNAKALRFVSAGSVIYRRRVNHPGIKARHFMEDALAANRERIRNIIQERVMRAAKGQGIGE